MKFRILTGIACLGAFTLQAQITESGWLAKADKFYSDKNYKNALPAYQEAYQINKQNETTIYRILYSQNEVKYYDDAIDFLNTLPLKMIVNNDDISVELCFAATHGTLYDNSITLLKNSLNLKPNKNAYIQAMANVYCNAKKYADAASTFAILDAMFQPGKVDYENWCYSLNELERYSESAATGKKGLGL